MANSLYNNDWLQGTTAAPTAPAIGPTPPTTPLYNNDWLKPDPSLAIKGAVMVSPDDEAKKQKLSQLSRLPVAAVEADPIAVEQFVKTREMAEKLLPFPVTSTWFSTPE